MAIKITNAGEKYILEAACGKVPAGNWKLKLFTNNFTPDGDEVPADFTEVGAVQGYAEKTLTTAGWNAGAAGTGVGTSTANKASISYPRQTWTADGTGGDVTCYGYYIVDNGGTVVIGSEKFATAQTLSASGDTIKIDLALTCATE